MVTLKKIMANKEKINALAKEFGVTNVRVFGSVARGEADEKSDIDLLVHFKPETTLFDQFALERKLSRLLHCKVHVLSDNGLRERIRKSVFAEMVTL